MPRLRPPRGAVEPTVTLSSETGALVAARRAAEAAATLVWQQAGFEGQIAVTIARKRPKATEPSSAAAA